MESIERGIVMGLMRISMKEQMYDIIKNRILSNEYKLGEQINIVSLSKEFETSNTPIREALAALEKEGLVTSKHNYRYQVVSLDEENCEKINNALGVLLCGAYREIVENENSKKLEKLLEKRLKEQKQIDPDNDMTEYIKASIRFDRGFLEVTENEYLEEMYDSMSGYLFLSARHIFETNRQSVEKHLAEHEDLIRAVRSEETEEVVRSIKNHYNKPYQK